MADKIDAILREAEGQSPEIERWIAKQGVSVGRPGILVFLAARRNILLHAVLLQLSSIDRRLQSLESASHNSDSNQNDD